MAVLKFFFFVCLFLSVRYWLSRGPPATAPSPDAAADSPVSDKAPGPASESESSTLGTELEPISSPPAPSPSDTSLPSSSPPALTADGGGVRGMSGGRKTAISAAVVLVGFGGLVYKKRQDNIRRAQRMEEGIAVGVLAAAALVGFGGLMYKTRQDNMRRAY